MALKTLLLWLLLEVEKNRLAVSLSNWLNKRGRLTTSILCMIDVWNSTEDVSFVVVFSARPVGRYMSSIADDERISGADTLAGVNETDRIFFGDSGFGRACWLTGVDAKENGLERIAYCWLQIDRRCAGGTDDSDRGGRYFMWQRYSQKWKRTASLVTYLPFAWIKAINDTFGFHIQIANSMLKGTLHIVVTPILEKATELHRKGDSLTVQQISDAPDRCHPDRDSVVLVFSGEDRRRSDGERWGVPVWILWYNHQSHEDSVCPSFVAIAWGSANREQTMLGFEQTRERFDVLFQYSTLVFYSWFSSLWRDRYQRCYLDNHIQIRCTSNETVQNYRGQILFSNRVSVDRTVRHDHFHRV